MRIKIIEVHNNLLDLGYSVEEIEVESCYKQAEKMLKDNGVEVQSESLTVVIEDILFSDDKYYQSIQN